MPSSDNSKLSVKIEESLDDAIGLKNTLKGHFPTITHTKAKDLKPDEEKHQELVRMAEEGGELFPDLEKEEEYKLVNSEYKELQKKGSKSNEDYDKLVKLDEQTQQLYNECYPLLCKVMDAMASMEENHKGPL